jgi:hypothetical protein
VYGDGDIKSMKTDQKPEGGIYVRSLRAQKEMNIVSISVKSTPLSPGK